MGHNLCSVSACETIQTSFIAVRYILHSVAVDDRRMQYRNKWVHNLESKGVLRMSKQSKKILKVSGVAFAATAAAYITTG